MNNAIEWLRSKATVTTDTMTVTPEEGAVSECAPGTYRITRLHFRGTLPYAMVRDLRSAKLTKTETVNEVLQIGGQYRSQYGQCEYFHTTYELVGA